MPKLYFVRRTDAEFEIFGGSVYMDIDGKRVGEVRRTNFVVDIDAGPHTITMYKSHTYDTFVGYANVSLNVDSEKDLTLQYVPPLVTSQPGHIVVKDFTSIDDINKQARQTESSLRSKKAESDYKAQKIAEEAAESNNKFVFWLVIVPSIFAIIYGLIYIATILS